MITVPEFQTSPGMRDILPPESARWRRFVEVFARVAEQAGYGQVMSPLLEDLGVFQRIGDATDVLGVKPTARFITPQPTARIAIAFRLPTRSPQIPPGNWKIA